MSPKYSNPNRRLRPPSGIGPTISLIITVVLLCLAIVVMKECTGGGRLSAPPADIHPFDICHT